MVARAKPVFTPDVVAKLSEPMPRGFHEAWPSPDGAFLAGHFQTNTGERMMIVPTAGGPLRKLETIPPNAAWAPDGRSLLFYSGRGGVFNMFRQSIDGGPVTPMTQFTSEQIFSLRAVTGPEAAGCRPRPGELRRRPRLVGREEVDRRLTSNQDVRARNKI